MIQRVLGALGAFGVGHVMMMPDMTGIAAAVERAIVAHRAEAHIPWPAVEFLNMDISESVTDTFNAVDLMVARGVAAIVVLGGDGTHRAVAMRCGDVPITTLSTGTNNAFPIFVRRRPQASPPACLHPGACREPRRHWPTSASWSRRADAAKLRWWMCA